MFTMIGLFRVVGGVFVVGCWLFGFACCFARFVLLLYLIVLFRCSMNLRCLVDI